MEHKAADWERAERVREYIAAVREKAARASVLLSVFGVLALESEPVDPRL